NVTVQTVTVLVDPDGAEKLALAVDQGSVHLSLRNPVDRSITQQTSKDIRTVMGMNSDKKPAVVYRAAPVNVTKAEPVPVKEEPTFTVIRDGKISKQESPTPAKDSSKDQ